MKQFSNQTDDLQTGDIFHCEQCGLQLEVVASGDHKLQQGSPVFRCCGGDLRPGGDSDETLSPEAARGDYIA